MAAGGSSAHDRTDHDTLNKGPSAGRMGGMKTPETSDELPLLKVPRAEAEELISHRIIKGYDLADKVVAAIRSDYDLENGRSEFTKWSDYNADLLEKIFDNKRIASDYRYSSVGIAAGWSSLDNKVKLLGQQVVEDINKLESIFERLELYAEVGTLSDTIARESSPRSPGRKVFVVHGHDEVAKLQAANLLIKLDIEPIILHEKPNQGRTIIEKFESCADVDFAVVLLTPDDVGGTTMR